MKPETREACAWILVVILVVAAAYLGVGWQNARTELEIEKAVAATGPCGDQFIVSLSSGKVAVAGMVVLAAEASNYFLASSAEGESVWKKSGAYDTAGQPAGPALVFRRCRCDQKQ